MSNKKIPFLTQAVLLEPYIHSENPNSDSDMVELILKILEKNKELRSYFFRAGPSAAWAQILWDNGFLSIPPKPDANGNIQPWDAQYYLISVAHQVPEIVLKHVKNLEGHGWYLARALEALNQISFDYSMKAISTVIKWLSDFDIRNNTQREILTFIHLLIKNGDQDSALQLFDLIVAPRPNTEKTIFDEFYIEIFESEVDSSVTFELLKNRCSDKLVPILEKHLITSLENDEVIGKNASWWRIAIENTNQDDRMSYKNCVLNELRDTLIIHINKDFVGGSEIVKRYLNEEISILRRLGLFIIQIFVNKYQNETVKELLAPENLEDVNIHHEYFTLLRDCFYLLGKENQNLLINRILEGPNLENLETAYESFGKSYEPDKKKFILKRKNAWTRDRLHMIFPYLNQEAKTVYENLSKEYKREHPEFTMWSSNAFFIQDTSPFSQQELSKLNSEEFYETVATWKPDTNQDFGPEEISYAGFAKEIAKVVCPFSDRYKFNLVDIGLLHPAYATAILDFWKSSDYTDPIPWENAISFCEGLLKRDLFSEEEKWRYVRLSIAGFLKFSVTANEKKAPQEFTEKIQVILFQLIKDPDPSMEDDCPPKGVFGYNDPIIVSINHVRPIALSALIQSELLFIQSKYTQEELKTIILTFRPEIKEKLEKMLDVNLEPSRAVRSVIGDFTPQLYWLDRVWFSKNIDLIFPTSADEDKKWLFISAWDTYVLDKYYPDLFEIMKPKYAQAIEYVSRGFVSESNLKQLSYLATHLLFNYLFSKNNINEILQQKSLLIIFYKNSKPEIHCEISEALWHICKNNTNKLNVFWPKVIELWEWRNREAIISNHSVDFDKEMQEFARLLQIAPETETILSLQTLLDGLLPHFRNSDNHNYGWRGIESFLAKEVKKHPVEVIQYYRKLCELRNTFPHWYRHTDFAKTIIEIGASNLKSREDALALIDFFAQRWNDYTFHPIYTQYIG